jgi:PIN domain nuclease of toxin-antitoxin system
MILLDTHIWIWWVQGDPRLTQQHQNYLSEYETEGLGVSIYSCWEIAKLVEYKRLTLPYSLEDWFDRAFAYPGIQLIHLTLPIAIAQAHPQGWSKHSS